MNIEGLACGCPCISSDNEGAKSVGSGFIKYVETGNIEEFYRETKSLLSHDVSERDLWGHKSAEFIESKYSIGKAATRYINLYNVT